VVTAASKQCSGVLQCAVVAEYNRIAMHHLGNPVGHNTGTLATGTLARRPVDKIRRTDNPHEPPTFNYRQMMQAAPGH
jgi:hypothetical protein